MGAEQAALSEHSDYLKVRRAARPVVLHPRILTLEGTKGVPRNGGRCSFLASRVPSSLSLDGSIVNLSAHVHACLPAGRRAGGLAGELPGWFG